MPAHDEPTDEQLLEQRASLAVLPRVDHDAAEDLRDVDAELDRRASVRREQEMLTTTTDTLNEDIDAAVADLVALLRRWGQRKDPMARVNLNEAVAWRIAEALGRGEGEVMANMVGRGLSRAAPLLAQRRTSQF